MSHTVYVIRNPEGLLYKGVTSDLEKRLARHNDGLGNWTKGRGPWTLVMSEQFETESEALKRERFLKSGQGRQMLKDIVEQMSKRSSA